MRILILGGGFGGVYTYKHLRRFFRNDKRIALTMVNQRNYFLFTPLLHEVATGGVARENVVEPLRNVLGCSGDEFLLAEVQEVDLRARRVTTNNAVLEYDYLVLALGSETAFFDIPGTEQYCFTLKSLEDAVILKNRFIRIFEKAATITDEEVLSRMLNFVVVGGGPTGVELAAEMAELFYGTFGRYYRNHPLYQKIKITLIQSAEDLLPHHSPRMRAKALDVLRKKRINVCLGARVTEVTKERIVLESGERLDSDTVIWVAGVKPREVPFMNPADIKLNSRGRIVVDEYLRMKEYPEVFVLGDGAAAMGENGKELPLLAQVATSQSINIARNIHAVINHRQLHSFRYRHAGDLVSLGQWMAIADLKGFFFWGHFSWWVWRTVYLSKLISFSKKIKVATDWTLNLFMPRDIAEL